MDILIYNLKQTQRDLVCFTKKKIHRLDNELITPTQTTSVLNL